MLEIRDEDRIIGRICRGELSIVDRDIINLASGNLTEKQEENFRKLAQEINETIDRNQTLRQEMKEKIDFVENSDYIVKSALSKIDNKIDDLKIEYHAKKYPALWKILIGAISPFVLGIVPTWILSLFTSSVYVLLPVFFVTLMMGCGILGKLVISNVNKCDKIEKQIKDLEKARLEIVSDGVDVTKTQENEIKMNIVKNIYKTRELEKQYQDILDL